MQCETVQNQLDDLLDGVIETQQAAALHAHIQGCEGCRKAWQLTRELSQHLAELPAIQPRAGYEGRVLAFLNTAQTTARPRQRSLGLWFGAGFATAFAAILAVALLFNVPLNPHSDSLPVMTVEMAPMQVRKVDLVFNSPRAIANTALRIELPKGTEIAGYPDQHSLEWTTSLKAGRNRLTLPLIIKTNKGGTLLARITHQNQSREFKIQVISTPASSQQTRIPVA